MESLNGAVELARSGRFTEALGALPDTPFVRHDHHDVLKAELLERTGEHGKARTLLTVLLNSKRLTLSDQSVCESVLARIEWEEGDTESALRRLQHSVSLAEGAHDLERKAWSLLWLLGHIADRSGPDAAAPLLAKLRSDLTRLGHPQLSAMLHIWVGQMEGKRGLLKSAHWHTRLGEQLLSAAPNVWVESMLETTKCASAMMRSDYDAALTYGQRALYLAERSGAAASRRTSLGNLGYLLYSTGQFAEAVGFFERAIAMLPSAGDNSNAALETLARIHLAQDQTDECASLLDRIDSAIRSPRDRMLYSYRHALLTRTHLVARQGKLTDALELVDSVLALATEAGDDLLSHMAQFTKAELLQQANRIPESLTLLDMVVGNLSSQPPDLHAQYERILACALASTGQLDAARLHRDRAERVYASLRHAPGLLELTRCWDAATRAGTSVQADRPIPTQLPTSDNPARAARNILEATASIVLHARRPELVAREIIDLFEQTGSVHYATALARAGDGGCEVLARTGTPPGPDTPPDAGERRMDVGLNRDRTIEITVRPKDDIESVATLHAVRLLLATIHDIERARAEREERMTLWPMDDLTTEAGEAVVTGRMRELMSFAKRIATTNVSVLITGESGTGKEILARAIHNYSERAQKPFIPFNCSAIPREMLESQLFGHRRGAFTGADRDNPGIIRSARDGTLFLDEIGELGLDLQPKLLRFLESGEICPLGESTPFTVDVRVIAATNSNLEQGVKEGRVREDLFYRLNVIRLQIPPLRERRDEIPPLVNHFVSRAAAEFRKSQIRVAEETMEHLLLCPWPGNIRQLHNEIRRMVALAEPNTILAPDALSNDIVSARPTPHATSNGLELAVPLHNKLLPTLSRIEREMIKVALHEHRGKVDAAARALGISRKGLYLKRQRLGL